MTMITPSYLGETIEYSSLHACRSTLEDPTNSQTAHSSNCPPFSGTELGHPAQVIEKSHLLSVAN